MTPAVRVLRGEPDDVELAALIAGLAAGTAGAADPDPDLESERADRARRRWRQSARPHPAPLTPGPDAWRWSTRH